MLDDHKIYCPICGVFLEAVNKSEVDGRLEDNYSFYHTPHIDHSESDIEAMYYPIQ